MLGLFNSSECARGDKGSLSPCFIVRELGEYGSEKGGVLSHIRPMYNHVTNKE